MVRNRDALIDKDGRVRMTFGFKPEVAAMLRDLAKREDRSMVSELSHLVVKRSRELTADDAGHLGQ